MDLDKDIDWGALSRNPYKRENKLSNEDLSTLMKVAWEGFMWEEQEIREYRRRKLEYLKNLS